MRRIEDIRCITYTNNAMQKLISLLDKLFRLRKKGSKQMNVSMISIKFVNLDLLADTDEPGRVVQRYTDCLSKIESLT